MPKYTGRPTAVRSAEHWENPLIPSGYTYLLQFVAHDLVHSAIPLSVSGSLGGGTANARRAPLRLETLYGSGPVGSPHIYALDAPNDDRRTKLRLGRMRWKENEPATGCPFRDIARTRAENVTGIDRSIAGVRVALTEALVADPRNDDHAVMSQLTALFALLHNGLIDLIRRQERNSGPNGQFGAAYKRFLCAREAVTLIYHNILRNDLMRRVIHPAIYAAYSGPAPHFIDRPDEASQGLAIGDWEIPFEFSHGAFRFGHAMVRHEYRINDLSLQDLYSTLEKTSANDPVNMPLDETWMVQWSRFFEINETEAELQPAHRTVSQRRAGQRPDLSGVRRDRAGWPALSRSARRRDRRHVVGGRADCRDRRPGDRSSSRMSRLLADRAYRVEPASRLAGRRTGVWRADGRRHRNPFERSAAALLHPVRSDAATAGRGPAPWAARLDHRIGSDFRRARRRSALIRRRRARRSARRFSREFYPTNVFRKFPTSQAWRNWWSSPPKLPICSRPCPHFCEAELFRLTQPGGVRRCSARKAASDQP